MYNCNEMSFVNIHITCKKSTPEQIMGYQSALQLHKVFSSIFIECTSEHVRILSNVVCSTGQIKFEIIRDNRVKIGMNTGSNKFYQLNKQISLDSINLSYVHFKKLMKIQFLKYGNSRFPSHLYFAYGSWSLF